MGIDISKRFWGSTPPDLPSLLRSQATLNRSPSASTLDNKDGHFEVENVWRPLFKNPVSMHPWELSSHQANQSLSIWNNSEQLTSGSNNFTYILTFLMQNGTPLYRRKPVNLQPVNTSRLMEWVPSVSGDLFIWYILYAITCKCILLVNLEINIDHLSNVHSI